MLEVAASPAYRDLMDALGKLAEWTEQAGQSSLPSGPPPEDLVQQFNAALDSAQGTEAVGSAENISSVSEAVFEHGPADIIAQSGLFPAGQEPVQAADSAARLDGLRDMPEAQTVELDSSRDGLVDRPDVQPVAQDQGAAESHFAGLRREVASMTEAQAVNLDKGLDALNQAAESRHTSFFESAHQLSELLTKPAMEISPADMLQAQRLVGILKVQSESGKKLSEGVSDTLEQMLEQQG